MDFKEYAVKQRIEKHNDILLAICMTIKNCADCINDETRHTDCYPSCLLRNDLINVTANGFYIESYDNSNRNIELLNLAKEYGYQAGFTEKYGVIYIKFWK